MLVVFSMRREAPSRTVRSVSMDDSFQVSVPDTVMFEPSLITSADTAIVAKVVDMRRSVTKENAVRMVVSKGGSVIVFAPSIRNILPSELVTDEVEGSVKDWGEQHKGNHWDSQFFSSQPRCTEKELTGQKDGNGEGQRVEDWGL